MSTHIEDEVAENSDFPFTCTFVGEDGSTPVGSDVVSEILMTIRDVTGDELIVPDRNVTSGLDVDGNFETLLTAADNKVIEGSGEKQLRLITFKITHSGTRKRNQEFTYYVDAMQDVPDTP